MSTNPVLYLACSSDIVSDYVERGVTSNSTFEVQRFRNFEELFRLEKPKGAGVVVLDYLLGGKKADTFISQLLQQDALRGIPILLTYSPSFARQARDLMRKYPKVREVLAKPFTVNQLVQVVMPFSVAIHSTLASTGTMTSTSEVKARESEKEAANTPRFFEEISAVRGVEGQFQWSLAGEVIATTGEPANKLSEAMRGALAQTTILGDNCGFGQLLEMQFYGKKQSAAMFAIGTSADDPTDFRTAGILVNSAMNLEETLLKIKTEVIQ